MRAAFFVLIALLCAHSVAAALDSQTVAVVLHKNGIVEERITLFITADDVYESVEYSVAAEPLSVLFDGEHEVLSAPEGAVIVLQETLAPGEHVVSFTLLFDDLIRSQGDSSAFSLQLEAPVLNVSLLLPAGAVLAAVDPAVSPRPASMETDGRVLTLRWQAQGELGLIVLYEEPAGILPWVVSAFVLFALATLAGVMLWRRKRPSQGVLLATLGTDEQAILSLVRKGIVNQKHLCRESGFSKSKMSKVVRKLEEKGVLTKEPFFKTNKLALQRGWR